MIASSDVLFKFYVYGMILIVPILVTAYVCEYQGCDRRFSVRSNAKRHLKTHAAPRTPHSNTNPLDSPTVTPSTKPVSMTGKAGLPRPGFVEFEPVIVGGSSMPGTGVRGTMQDAQIIDRYGPGGRNANGEGVEQGTTTRSTFTYPEPAFFKVRWMPLSVTSERSNATQFDF
jgi:hypothetical protein